MSTTDINARVRSTFLAAAPFYMSLIYVPILYLSGANGGLWLLLPFIFTWVLTNLLDLVGGMELKNLSSDTSSQSFFWYKLVTMIWPPVQFFLIFGGLFMISGADHLSGFEKIAFMAGVGLASGTIGINYAHELMHQKTRLERTLADILLAMVLYSHFRSEHLLVHHRYVGTPRDAVTARYNEGLWRFLPRVFWECFVSAWKAERQMLARKNAPVSDRSNPFWTYGMLQAGFLFLAFLIGGWFGLIAFVVQALVAVLQLETINYVEHYGLTRKYLGDGKYEPTMPHHSWNASFKVTNWLLINLQRHSDHHYKPDRRFPLLQTYDESDAPQLPFNYALMSLIAAVPPVWRRMMNPKVRSWRNRFYPEIADWRLYNQGKNPLPKGGS